MFYLFIRACRKYKFTFVLNTYGSIYIILRPINTFENIEIKGEYCEYGTYNKLFSKAIKIMKEYRMRY